MTTTVQPRHVKLAFAGREKNWVFAAYELKQMNDSFDRLSVQWPVWRQQPMVELVETIVRDPLFEERLSTALSKGQNQVHGTGGIGLTFGRHFELNAAIDIASTTRIFSTSLIVR